MGVVEFPREPPVAIDRPREIGAVESLIAALAAFVDAAGGATALGGRDLRALPLEDRIRRLGRMYAEGRVALAWRDGRDGRRFAATLEKRRSSRTGESWRVAVRAEADAPGPVLVLTAPGVEEFAPRLLRALADGFAQGRRRAGSPIAQFGHHSRTRASS